MLRKDTKCKFENEDKYKNSYRFSINNLSKSYYQYEYKELIITQKITPVAILFDESNSKRWWMYKNEFYCENDGYNPKEIEALIFENEHIQKKKVNKAISLMSQETIPNKNKREMVPEDVRLYVWNRDGGRCVKCGSQKKIEYDHIIPVSKGGSNTARNIQILCEECNRSKGDSLV